MKKSTLFLIVLLASFMCGCLKNEELPPPVITLSQAEGEILLFSTIQSADVQVHVESGDELKFFRTKTVPMSSWSDTIIAFDPFTHFADINLSFKMWKGYRNMPNDSLFEVTYTVSTEDTSCSVKRKLRYRMVYPRLDSFDIQVESAPYGKCLIDIDNRCVYTFLEYHNHSYDLVYVNEMSPNEGTFGTALISPDAPYLMRYFQSKLGSAVYDPSGKRHTSCGVVIAADDSDLDWSKFNSTMLGQDNNWLVSTRINALIPNDGVGVVDLQKNKLFKFQLYNGRYVMIKILDRALPQEADKSVITMRVYLQQ